MFLALIFGLLTGGIIPFLAGRFGKLIPADPGLLLLKLPHLPRFPKANDPMRFYLLKKKWQQLCLISCAWGIIMGSLFVGCHEFLSPSYWIWGCVFCWVQGISMAIDAQYWLLPDFFTIPLILLGFLFCYQHPEIGVQSALIGSMGGYLICTLSVFLMGLFSKKTMFGGGDLKMITALGAWLGILGLNYTLIASFLLFIVLNTLPFQRKGAYGPALGLASIIVFFIMYAK